MAETKDYTYNPVNLAPGVPQRDYARGRALQGASANIGAIREKLAQARMAGINAVLQPLEQAAPSAGALIGKAIHNSQKAAYNLTVIQNKSTIEDFVHSFDTDINEKLNQIKQDNINTPDAAAEQTKAAINQRKDSLNKQWQNSPSLQKTPELKYTLFNRVNALADSYTKQSDDWTHTQLAANDHANFQGEGMKHVDNIADLQGTIPEKLAAFQTMQHGYVNYANNKAASLGAPFVNKESDMVLQKGSVQFVNNLVADQPDDPEKRFPYLQQVDAVLRSATPDQLPIRASDRKTLEGTVRTAVNQASTDLTNHYNTQVLQDEVDIGIYRNHLDSNRSNANVQQQAIVQMQQETAKLKGEVAKVESDPNIPDKVKTAYLARQNAKLKLIDGTMGVAQHHLDHIEALDRADSRQTLSDQRHAAVEARRLASDQRREKHEQEREEREAKHHASEAKQFELGDMSLELTRLQQDIGKNAPAIQALMEKGFYAAREARDNGTIDANQYLKYASMFSKGAVKAAEVQRTTIPILNWQIGDPHKVKPNQSQAARVQAINEVQGVITTAEFEHRQNELNKVAGIKPGSPQAQYYHTQFDAWLQARAAKKLVPTMVERQHYANLIRNSALTTVR